MNPVKYVGILIGSGILAMTIWSGGLNVLTKTDFYHVAVQMDACQLALDKAMPNTPALVSRAFMVKRIGDEVLYLCEFHFIMKNETRTANVIVNNNMTKTEVHFVD